MAEGGVEFQESQFSRSVHTPRQVVSDPEDPLFGIKTALITLRFRMDVAERSETLAFLTEKVASLSGSDFDSLLAWRSKGYEKLLNLLRKGSADQAALLELCHMFRWAQDGVTKDVPFVESMLESIAAMSSVAADPAAFPQVLSYRYATVLQDKWNTAKSPASKRIIAGSSLPLLKHLMAATDYLRNRATFMYAQACLLLGDRSGALTNLLAALRDPLALTYQRELLCQLILSETFPRLPRELSQLFLTDQRYLNGQFWRYVERLLSGYSVGQRAGAFAALLEKAGLSCDSAAQLDSRQESVLLDLAKFWSAGFPADSVRCIEHCRSLLDREELKSLLSEIHAQLCFLYLDGAERDLFAAFEHATESLSAAYSPDVAVAMQRVFLALDQKGMLESLAHTYARGSVGASARERAFAEIHAGALEPQWIRPNGVDELSAMQRLTEKSTSTAARQIAIARAATISIRGECSPGQHLKMQRYQTGQDYLNHFSDGGPLARLKASLQSFGFFRQQGSLIQSGPHGDWIWLDKPESDELIIAFADRFSYHVFPSVPSLVKERRTNVLFINNPVCNWYSDDEVARIDALIRELVIGRFDADKVTCYHGSMGGYGAILFARRFGFSVIAVNPQVNLDLWAMDRPQDAERIMSVENRVNLDQLPASAYEGARFCFMVGQYPTDSIAFQALLAKLAHVKNLSLIIERFAIAQHEGLIAKAYGTKAVETVATRAASLTQLGGITKPGTEYRSIDAEERRNLFQVIKDSAAGRWELIARDGTWYVR